MKKRVCAVLLGAALALALAGCGSSQPQSSSAAGSGAASAVSSGAASEAASASESVAGSQAALASETEASAAQPFFGVWEVTPGIQFSSVSALTAEEAQKYVGAKVEYRADAVLCNGETVASGVLDYTAVPYDEAKLVEEFRANLGEWWNALPEVSFMEPSPTSIDGFGTQFFLAGENAIWIYHEGAFFFAKPAA